MPDILMWILAVEVLGLACLPLLRAFFENRRDAALLSRPVGLALVAYLGWAFSLSRSFGFERGTLLLALVLIGVASFLVRRAASRTEAPSEGPFWGKEERSAALFFWIPTAVFVLIRAAVPEVLGAEKFMDLAFFNSLTRFGAMPPTDPWMAGQTINYYYWGYLLAAALAKLAAVPTFVSYNLAVGTFAGYSFVAAACLGLRLSGGRRAAGVWAGIGAVFAGNLTGAFDAWRAPFAKDFDYWHASRVIASGNTINEFPFFTFFHADLHPHLLAFPFFIAAFVIAHRYLQMAPEPLPTPWKPAAFLRQAWPPFLLALLAGTARAGNNWNLPALGLLLVFTGAFRQTGGRRLPAPGDALWGAIVGAGLLLLALVLFIPYSRSYSLQVQGLGRTTMKSDLLEFLGVWGILLAAGYAGLLCAASAAAKDEASRRRGDLLLTIFAAASLFAAFAARAPALVMILPLGLLGFWLAFAAVKSPEGDPDDLFTAFLVVLSVGIIVGCEFIYFKDSYGQALQRMNTIFKFYHQAWPLLAIGVAVLAERAWREAARGRAVVRMTLTAAMVLCLFYPVEAAASRFRQREAPFSLDLRQALARRNSGDAAAIDWLLKHAAGGSVVMEATGDPYSEYARISSHTGLPTVLGWANHEGLWRSKEAGVVAEVAQRSAIVRSFYAASDPKAAERILQRYHVTYVVVGDMERRSYPTAANVASFPFLQPVLPGDTTVYRVTAAP
jgi:YYY domain-containing protein